MEVNINDYLSKKGYKVDNSKALSNIEIAEKIYKNKELDYHKLFMINGTSYQLERLNFGKRLCADDANLCEIIEINAQNTESDNKIITDIFKANNFDVMYRKQLEEMSAMGTVGAYIRVEDAILNDNGDVTGGNIVINYANAKNIVILTCINNEILEVAFKGTSYDKQGSKQAIVMFTLDENSRYKCTTAYFDKNNNLIDETEINLGEVKPFSIMRVAQVNNLDDMLGYGLPKLFTALPNLKTLELSYNLWFRDLDKADKMVFISQALGQFNDKTNKYELPNDACRKIFMLIGGQDLPEAKTLVQEYNPVIRINEAVKSIELALSMCSLMFGYGTKKYSFEDGRIVTATEYIGSKQDQMQELNKQRFEAIQYITGLVKAIRWFLETLQIETFPDDEININFDDSYVTDKATELEAMRNDALSFDIEQLKIKYFVEKYSISEKEAKQWLDSQPIQTTGEENEE